MRNKRNMTMKTRVRLNGANLGTCDHMVSLGWSVWMGRGWCDAMHWARSWVILDHNDNRVRTSIDVGCNEVIEPYENKSSSKVTWQENIKCNFNHDGPCTPRCYKCNKIGHLSRDCRSPTNANVANNQRGNEAGQKVTWNECGEQGHFKRYCPKLKNNNNNRGNQVGTGNAQARVYAMGNAGTNPDANTVTDHDYAVELADGRIVAVKIVIRSCTLNFLNHPFNIDLMPVEMGSFDVIIGMDWLSRYQAVIVCADKIVHVPWGRETLIFHDDGSNQE
nr:hypothetical protein [Tanacetum cinerariifolium]